MPVTETVKKAATNKVLEDIPLMTGECQFAINNILLTPVVSDLSYHQQHPDFQTGEPRQV